MPLKFKCNCGTMLTVPTQRVGKSARCPACNETIVIGKPSCRQTSLSKLAQSEKPTLPTGECEQPATSVSTTAVKPLTTHGASDTHDVLDESLEARAVLPSMPQGPIAADSAAPASNPAKQQKTIAARIEEKKRQIRDEELAREQKEDDVSESGRRVPASSLEADRKPSADSKIDPPPTKARDSAAKQADVAKPPPIKARVAEQAPQAKSQEQRLGPSPPPLGKRPPQLRANATTSEPTKNKQSQQPKPDKKRQGAKSDRRLNETKKRPQMRGVEHDPAKRWAACYLAIAVIMMALINIAPAFYQGVQSIQNGSSQPLARWAYGALILSLIHIAYAIYLIQLPDWSSAWVVAVLSLATTTLNAVLASVVSLGDNNSALLGSLELVHASRRSPILWCLIMLIVSASITYLAGRLAIRWHKAFSNAYPATSER